MLSAPVSAIDLDQQYGGDNNQFDNAQEVKAFLSELLESQENLSHINPDNIDIQYDQDTGNLRIDLDGAGINFSEITFDFDQEQDFSEQFVQAITQKADELDISDGDDITISLEEITDVLLSSQNHHSIIDAPSARSVSSTKTAETTTVDRTVNIEGIDIKFTGDHPDAISASENVERYIRDLLQYSPAFKEMIDTILSRSGRDALTIRFPADVDDNIVGGVDPLFPNVISINSLHYKEGASYASNSFLGVEAIVHEASHLISYLEGTEAHSPEESQRNVAVIRQIIDNNPDLNPPNNSWEIVDYSVDSLYNKPFILNTQQVNGEYLDDIYQRILQNLENNNFDAVTADLQLLEADSDPISLKYHNPQHTDGCPICNQAQANGDQTYTVSKLDYITQLLTYETFDQTIGGSDSEDVVSTTDRYSGGETWTDPDTGDEVLYAVIDTANPLEEDEPLKANLEAYYASLTNPNNEGIKDSFDLAGDTFFVPYNGYTEEEKSELESLGFEEYQFNALFKAGYNVDFIKHAISLRFSPANIYHASINNLEEEQFNNIPVFASALNLSFDSLFRLFNAGFLPPQIQQAVGLGLIPDEAILLVIHRSNEANIEIRLKSISSLIYKYKYSKADIIDLTGDDFFSEKGNELMDLFQFSHRGGTEEDINHFKNIGFNSTDVLDLTQVRKEGNFNLRDLVHLTTIGGEDSLFPAGFAPEDVKPEFDKLINDYGFTAADFTDLKDHDAVGFVLPIIQDPSSFDLSLEGLTKDMIIDKAKEKAASDKSIEEIIENEIDQEAEKINFFELLMPILNLIPSFFGNPSPA